VKVQQLLLLQEEQSQEDKKGSNGQKVPTIERERESNKDGFEQA